MSRNDLVSLPAVATALVLAACTAFAQDRPPVLVFVLAGQSNMEGKVQNTLLEYQARDPKTAPLFAHLRDGDHWAVRDDVWIDYSGRRGGLTIGYGSPERTGVELELGTVLGDHLKPPVLLVKTAWGGHSLYRQFRPPSAGLPDGAHLASELKRARERVARRNERQHRRDPLPTMGDIRAEYGRSYRAMIAAVKESVHDCAARFPALAGHRPELAGFVWFQGWNDQYDGAEVEYRANLEHLIHDVRRDLGAPALPFVIGVMGQNGSKPAKGAMKAIQDAQCGVAEEADLRAGVRAVRTDSLVDRAAEALYPTWKEHREQWQHTGSDHGYHYLGSAIWYLRIGHAMGEAMLDLLASKD